MTEDDGFNLKNWVWIPDSTFYTKGYITDYLNDGKCKVTVINGNQETHEIVSQDKLENCNPNKFNKCNDMAELTHLNEPSVVYNLYLRYNDDMIYTYSGLFLVAINPYKSLPIYDNKFLKKYHTHDFDKPPPHIFATAEGTYRNLLANKKDQLILVTGESGAGKTENTKKIIQYLSSITPPSSPITLNFPNFASSNSSTSSFATQNIDTKILQANPILESFGNAKTIKNNNSSRFGKFIRIFFSPRGLIKGANIDYYLLEKSRVVGQSNQERNYHVFYQFLKGYTQLEDFGLSKDIMSYAYLNESTLDIPNIDDSKEFNILVDGFNIMGFTTLEINNIFLVLAVILHLGNLDFTSLKAEQASFTAESPIDIIVKLLGVDKKDFVNNLVCPQVKAGREFVKKSKKAPEVKYGIDAFAKHLYEKLFQYIIERINVNLKMEHEDDHNFIGVLDIAGFEIFEINSFEQLCINYTNEKLQQYFNHHSFILEQSEYLREDIQWEFIDFGQDLQPTIDLIEMKIPLGILKTLDEECAIPTSSDKTFMEKLSANWGKGQSNKFQENKYKNGFIIHHYAGMVEYNVDNWLQKNTDPVNDHVLRLLPTSTNPFIADIFATDEHILADIQNNGPGNKRVVKLKTASLKHKEQLGNLMEQLECTEPHFVRCILPNLDKKPNKFDKTLVLHQLRCNGVLEGIRITRAGYPNRMTFDDFYLRYSIINIKEVFTKNMKTNSELLLKFIKLEAATFKMGITKIFFKNGILGKLEEMRDLSLKSIFTDLQSLFRGISARKLMEIKIQEIQSSQLIARTIKKIDESLTTSLWLDLFINIKPLLEESIKVLDSKEMNENLKNVSLKLKDAEKSKSNLETDNNKLRDQLIRLEDEVIATTELVKVRDIDLTKLKGDEKSANAKVLELESKLVELKQLNKVLEANLISVGGKSSDVSEKLKQKSAEYSTLQKEHTDTLSELSNIQLELKRHEVDKTNHNEFVASLKKEHESSKSSIQTETEKLKSLNEKLEKDLAKHKGFGPQNENLNKEILSLKDSIAKHLSIVTQREREINSLKSNFKRNEESNSALERKLVEAQNKVREINNQMESKSNEIKKSQVSSTKLLSEAEQLRQQVTQLKSLEKEIKENKKQEQLYLTEIETLTQTISLTNEENRAIVESFDKLKVEHELIRKSNLEYSSRIFNLNKTIEELQSMSGEYEKENFPPSDPNFVDDFAHIKYKLNEQNAALRKEKFENKKLQEELSLVKERNSNGTSTNSSFASRRSVADFSLSGGVDSLSREIENLKQKLQQEEANSQRAETYAIQLQKKLNKVQSTRGVNSFNDYEKKYREAQIRIAELEKRFEEFFLSENGSMAKSLPRSESSFRNSMVQSTLAGANLDFVTIYQDITRTLKSTREELSGTKTEILRLKSLLRESEDELYDAKRLSFRTSVSDYEDDLAQLTVKHDSLTSKNIDLTQSVEIYKKRAEEYYTKLEQAESAVNISKRHEEDATRELNDSKNQLKLAREESRATQILIVDIRKQNSALEGTIQEKSFEIQQLNKKINELNEKTKYYTSNYDNREVAENFKEEIRNLHKDLNFKMETETKLVKENRKHHLDLEDLTREKKALDIDYEKAMIKEEELEQQVEELSLKSSQLDSERIINERKINNLTRQVTSLKEVMEEISNQRDELKEKKDQLEEELLLMTNKYEDTNSKLVQSQLDLTIMRQHLENQREASYLMKTEFNQSKISTSNEVQDYHNLRKEKLVTEEENDSLKRVNKELTTKVHTLEEKLYSNEQLKYWETKVKDLMGNLDESQNENYASSKQVKSLERQVKELSIRAENEAQLAKRYNDENFDYQNKLNHYKSDVDILQNEIEEKGIKINSFERDYSALKEEKLMYQKEVLELRERLGLRSLTY